jgi:membrane protease YdiL (CAAX protease family)
MEADLTPRCAAPAPQPPKRLVLFGRGLVDLLFCTLSIVPLGLLVGMMGLKTSPQVVVREDHWRFLAMPSDENALLRWAAEQRGLTNFRAERPNEDNRLVLRYTSSAQQGPAHPNWDSLGYRMAYLVSVKPLPAARQPAASSWLTEASGRALASVFLLGTLAIGGVAWFRLNREKRSGVRLILLTDPPTRGWWLWLSVAFVSVVAFEAMYSWLLGTLHVVAVRDVASEIFLRFRHGPWYIVVTGAALGVLIAPVAEELLFRGCIFGRFRAHGYILSGAIISALLFSLMHDGLLNMPRIFILGLALAWLYHKAGSLWPPIALHVLNNSLALGLLLLRKSA